MGEFVKPPLRSSEKQGRPLTVLSQPTRARFTEALSTAADRGSRALDRGKMTVTRVRDTALEAAGAVVFTAAALGSIRGGMLLETDAEKAIAAQAAKAAQELAQKQAEAAQALADKQAAAANKAAGKK